MNKEINEVFASIDAKTAQIKNSPIREFVSNSLAVGSLVAVIASNELESILEQQLLEKAQRRAKMLASS
jgi:hypothetical protein